jgi:hypothetical protein
MRLKHHRSGSDNFSPLASLIAWGTHQIETSVRSRQCVRLRQCALAGGLPCSIYIDHQPLSACPIKQTAGRGKRFASKQILLKERSQGFQCRLSEGGKKTGED